MSTTHLSSSFVIKISSGFLNGMGNVREGKGDVTKVKQISVEGRSQPYVSAQAWRKWLRDGIAFDRTEPGYYERLNGKKLTNTQRKSPKGRCVDPVIYLEDDLFGYSHPFLELPIQDDPSRYNIVSTNRLSPFQTSILNAIERTTFIKKEQGWLHLRESTPLPYTTEFISGYLTGSATLDLTRVGVYRNHGDLFEIDPTIAEYHRTEGKLVREEKSNYTKYILTNKKQRKMEGIEGYYSSLLNLRGSAKSAQYATDLSPRIIVSAGLSSANNLFHSVFCADEKGNLKLDFEGLERIIASRGHTLTTDILLGYRSGTMIEHHETQLYTLEEMQFNHKAGNARVIITTPGKVASLMLEKGGKR